MSELNYKLKTVNKAWGDKITGEDHKCSKCGHSWRSRPWRFKGREEPKKCSKCGSRYWWVRQEKKAPAKPYLDPRIGQDDIEALNELFGGL